MIPNKLRNRVFEELRLQFFSSIIVISTTTSDIFKTQNENRIDDRLQLSKDKTQRMEMLITSEVKVKRSLYDF